MSSEYAYRLPEKMYRRRPERSRQRLDAIVQFIGPKAGQTIVDVGTGAGFLAMGLAERVGKNGKVIGIDNSKSAIRQARRKAARKNQHQTLEFKLGDVYSIPSKDDFADVVCCKSLVASLDHRLEAMSEMVRVAKHGGSVVVAEPGELRGIPVQIRRAYYAAIHSQDYFNERDIRALFHEAGLRKLEVMIKEPSVVTDVSAFEWTTKNLFGEESLWELAKEGGADEGQVRLAHDEAVKQIKLKGLKFGTGVVLCKGVRP
jgi:ubiquinone/menaquinone biosynthesis C-methylase UbiE